MYRLASPIGPMSDMAGPSPGEPFPTDKGNFILTAGSVAAIATFTVITAAVTPDPLRWRCWLRRLRASVWRDVAEGPDK